MKLLVIFFAMVSVGFLTNCTAGDNRNATSIEKIDHIVVIYLENRSFDNMYALFPGADTALTPKEKTYPLQVDKTGRVYTTLPPAMSNDKKPATVDKRFPTDLPNQPFLIDKYLPLDQIIANPTHRFYQNQEQINGGRNDKFAAISEVGGLVMGYHDTRKTALWRYAETYTLADNFFQAAFGGSFLNHFWLVCACTPRYDYPPTNLVAVLDERGKRISDGTVTPDGYAVNTIESVYQPHDRIFTDTKQLLPPQTDTTIGDRLSEQNISWKWYSGGWNDAMAGKPNELFEFHHQPFVYFKQFADGTEAKKAHLKDRIDLINDIQNNMLPAVAFYKPMGKYDQHPGYANVIDGDADTADIISQIEKSPAWNNTAIIVTYDENGGLWDHVAPPKGDRWGPGNRVPAIIISPYAKRGFIDHTQYDTTSILKFIELRFGLLPLTYRDARANSLTNAFDF